MNTPENAAPPMVVPMQTFNIRVLGVGGAGGNAVAHLAREQLPGVSCAVLNTDAQALARLPVETRVNLGTKTMRGLGAGGDPERGRAAAEEDAASVRALCDGADVVLVVAGLGGGTGTGAGPVIARLAKEAGALVLAIAFLPFECEGARRARQAHLGLHELKKMADGVICLPNQQVFRLVDENTSLLEAFSVANELVAQGVRGIWRLLARPGLINVDFADLCAVTRGQHAESALATVEARGANRAREALDKLLAHPLLDGGKALADAAAVLVSIAAGPDLTMAEVTRLMEPISRQAEHAHLILGAAIEAELGDRLLVTLVASRAANASGDGVEPATASEVETAEPDTPSFSRPASRFVPPAPELPPEKAEQLLARQTNGNGRQRRRAAKMLQGQLPLEIVSKGRFEKSEPTIHQGQDLDIPTYIRRGVALN